MILQPGQQIDRFVVERALGQGGMAAVYRVRHTTLDAVYALKILTIPNTVVRDRMLREGRFQATLRHTNIVSVIDVLDIHGVLGLLMEYVDGPTLAEWLAGYRPPLREAMAIFGGVLSAVDMVHARGVIHRDLKPSNILLEINDEGLYPRVTDFGIAKSDHLSQIDTGAGGAVGTPAYMAPEQFKNASTVDQRADVFSLGAILYELVCGQRAFQGDNILALMNDVARGVYVPPEQLVPDLPRSVRAAISCALRPNADERLNTCKELAALLTGQTAVHNIGDAMQRRLFRTSSGALAAMALRDAQRRSDQGRAFIPSVPPVDRTFGSAPPRVDAPSHTPLYDAPMGVFTEESSSQDRREPAAVLLGPNQYAVVLLFLLVLAVGLLGGTVITMLARDPRGPALPVETVAPPDLEPGRAFRLDAVPGSAPPPAPAPLPAPSQAAPAVPQPADQAPPAALPPEPTAPAPRPTILRAHSAPPPRTQVSITGDVPVSLHNARGTVTLPATVAAGAYTVLADFGDGPQEAATITVHAGQPLQLTCDPAFLVCRVVDQTR